MKRIVIIMVLLVMSMFFISCKAKPNKITDVSEFEAKFSGAIKYDIRDEKECEESHIPGFMCMGGKEADVLIHNIDVVAKDKNQNIILIGEEKQVLYILNGLSKKGYKNLFYFEGGFLGYASAKGEEFIPETGCGC
ncbi:MAG: rhodanese-like domain-containing protein [Bacilli bacterium]|nr:rhodanese-like domain-containing protein [Bacilli bacterium]